jgi:hypothetical protein
MRRTEVQQKWEGRERARERCGRYDEQAMKVTKAHVQLTERCR